MLEELPRENYLRRLDRDQIVNRLTHYLAEINATHPFREGNGRTQRSFLGQLAADAGYLIAWERLDPQRNINASRVAHRGDNRPLRAMLAELIVDIR